MERARAFFYVSIGILALVGAFYLGANSALWQSSSTATIGGLSNIGTGTMASAVDQSGMLWVKQIDQPGGSHGPFQPPRVGRIVAIQGEANDGRFAVLYQNGDAYQRNENGVWVYEGNLLPGGPVPTTPPASGRIKAERR